MHRIPSSFITLLLLCRLSSCAAFVPASVTASIATRLENRQPSPIPTLLTFNALEARQRPDNLCGFIAGDAANPYICSGGLGCRVNTQYGAIGCVSVDIEQSTNEPVLTACFDYVDYTNGLCATVGSRTGCCWDPNYPICVKNTYTGAQYNGYSMLACDVKRDNGVVLNYAATTSKQAVATTTAYVYVPVMSVIGSKPPETSAPAQESTAQPSAEPTTEPNTQPDGLSTSDKITLGTALGIGLPATIAGLIATWYTWKARVKKRKGAMLKDDDQETLIADDSESSEPAKVSNQSHVTMKLLGVGTK